MQAKYVFLFRSRSLLFFACTFAGISIPRTKIFSFSFEKRLTAETLCVMLYLYRMRGRHHTCPGPGQAHLVRRHKRKHQSKGAARMRRNKKTHTGRKKGGTPEMNLKKYIAHPHCRPHTAKGIRPESESRTGKHDGNADSRVRSENGRRKSLRVNRKPKEKSERNGCRRKRKGKRQTSGNPRAKAGRRRSRPEIFLAEKERKIRADGTGRHPKCQRNPKSSWNHQIKIEEPERKRFMWERQQAAFFVCRKPWNIPACFNP